MQKHLEIRLKKRREKKAEMMMAGTHITWI
jgi:hypothetical protein